MEFIFWILFVGSILVSYTVSRAKGYSGILFAVASLIFPFTIILVFLLPDKRHAAKESAEQRRKMDEMAARIRELESQQKNAQPKTEPKPVTKPASKPVQTKPVSKSAPSKPAQTKAAVSKPVPKAEPKPVDRKTRADACFKDGFMLYAKGDYVKAWPLLEEAAKLGNGLAQHNCALMCERGLGRPADPAEALRWYEAAAEQGIELALGYCYQYYQKQNDWDKATYWLKRAAEHGNAGAQSALAQRYEKNHNFKDAVYWAEKASAQGDEKAKATVQRLKEEMAKREAAAAEWTAGDQLIYKVSLYKLIDLVRMGDERMMWNLHFNIPGFYSENSAKMPADIRLDTYEKQLLLGGSYLDLYGELEAQGLIDIVDHRMLDVGGTFGRKYKALKELAPSAETRSVIDQCVTELSYLIRAIDQQNRENIFLWKMEKIESGMYQNADNHFLPILLRYYKTLRDMFIRLYK